MLHRPVEPASAGGRRGGKLNGYTFSRIVVTAGVCLAPHRVRGAAFGGLSLSSSNTLSLGGIAVLREGEGVPRSSFLEKILVAASSEVGNAHELGMSPK